MKKLLILIIVSLLFSCSSFKKTTGYTPNTDWHTKLIKKI